MVGKEVLWLNHATIKSPLIFIFIIIILGNIAKTFAFRHAATFTNRAIGATFTLIKHKKINLGLIQLLALELKKSIRRLFLSPFFGIIIR